MPEKPPAKSPPKSPQKSPPKPLTSITKPSTFGTPNPRGPKPSGAGTNRPPLANQHDRIWKIMKM
ncbi:uncharacterized protein [Drosophila kikkawai]|uniref:Uncharacterized protein n=1 Tax=Drosophila kikkawai TaxID=30033 RepID=A0ABM4GKV9_DROKI